MRIELGLMAKPLKEQLAGCVEETTIEVMQKDADAITRLKLRGYISSKEAKQARHRLVKASREAMEG